MSKYSKPNILFQPMTLLANVNESCSNGIDHNDKKSCTAPDPITGEIIFTSQCDNKYVPDEFSFDTNDSVCYHAPFVTQNVFMS
jgi:hypothetical protein